VESLLQQGGQGTAYIAKETRSGDKGVLKIFADSFDRRDTATRVRFLVKEKLHEASPLFATPLDSLTRQSALAGHYCRLAPGLPLDQHLASIRCGFLENLVLAIALAHAVETLHGRNIVHGDLQASNLLVEQVNGKVCLASLSLIDLDNFYAPGQPQPPCVGHSLYMSPELYHAMKQKRPTIPTRQSDLFSLGVLMHEIILLKHPAAGCDHNEAQFERAMYSDAWQYDPARSERSKNDTGGYPAEIVNADLARLFRKCCSLEPTERPAATEWKTTLCKALREVFVCPVCHNPCLIDSSNSPISNARSSGCSGGRQLCPDIAGDLVEVLPQVVGRFVGDDFQILEQQVFDGDRLRVVVGVVELAVCDQVQPLRLGKLSALVDPLPRGCQSHPHQIRLARHRQPQQRKRLADQLVYRVVVRMVGDVGRIEEAVEYVHPVVSHGLGQVAVGSLIEPEGVRLVADIERPAHLAKRRHRRVQEHYAFVAREFLCQLVEQR
jgi:serine/threonine protein kinase